LIPILLPLLLAGNWNNQTMIDEQVIFPSPEVEFIIGPQVKSGTSTASGTAWFDQNAIDRGLVHGSAFPMDPPMRQLTGTVAVEWGSNLVTGTNTKFTQVITNAPDTAFWIRDTTGVLRSHYIKRVVDDTSLELTMRWGNESSESWGQPSQSGLSVVLTIGDELNPFIDTNYYDQAFVHWINFYRTGDIRFRDYARKIADCWWRAPFIDEGRTPAEFSLAPRNISLNGLILRALDGRPEMWPWITNYVRTHFEQWIGTPIRLKFTGLYFGVRDGGFTVLYASNLARVHPDAVVRDEMRGKAVSACLDYYLKMQQADGSWRWGGAIDVGDTMQPFHVGILLEGMIQAHRLMGDSNIAQSIVRGAQAVYSLGYNPNGWRATYYFVGGRLYKEGSTTETIDCTAGCGLAANPWPASPLPDGTTVEQQVSEARQLNNPSIHALAYAYQLTGDTNLLRVANEMFDSSYSGADSYRSLASFRAKEYDESYRSGGRYLAWREGATSVVDPSPTPTPTPTPSPTPSPTPDPGPVVGSRIIVVWETTEGKQNQQAATQRALGYYFYRNLSGKKAEFVYTGVKLP
jgi:hypothetical protein